MKDLDLRQVGQILGLPLYVDVSSIPNYRSKDDLLDTRDKKKLLVRKMLESAFNVGVKDDEKN